MKTNDVFHWSYNEDTLKAKGDGNNGGMTYWCCSRIAIFDGEILRETFWSTSSQNRNWTVGEVSEDLSLIYLGNLDDYHLAEPHDRSRYKDADCLDLNHSNSTRGNFYIRKNAVPCVDKMKRITERSLKHLERKIAYELSQIERYKERIEEGFTEDSYVPYEREVSLMDDSYEDYQ